MEFLPTKFVEEYVKENPKPLSELGEFVFYRTYSRWLESRGRREYWHETVKRSIEYNMALGYKHTRDIGYKVNLKEMRDEAKQLFKNIYHTKQFPSGRTLWIGNANEKVNEEFVLGNFNCSFLNIESWDDIGDLFYLLMVGTGVGFKSTKKLASKMDKIRINSKLLHSEYKPVPSDQRLENTKVVKMDNGFAKIYVGDSKEGWVSSLREYFDLLTNKENEEIHTIKISYNSVRPKGERLKTFGGSASGFEPLKEMFEGIDDVLKNNLDANLDPIIADENGYGQPRPIHILDIGNLVGANVVIGGVRRTAEIFLFDADDYEVMLAKYGINGIWDIEQHTKIIHKLRNLGKLKEADFLQSLPTKDPSARPLHHRRMSNNSVWFEKKPLREEVNLIYELMKAEGEPGFGNAEAAKKRRPNAEGVNPCFEILLDSNGVCNLTTVNLMGFVNEVNGNYELDVKGLLQAQRLSARIGLRMTLATLELPHWNKVQQRDRLIGTSLTGWQDAISLLGYDKEQQEQLMIQLKDAAREESIDYADKLRVSTPLLATTLKPEGTLSQVAGGVSSGLHMSHSPYYIRRIRINSNDPLAQVAKELGWTINPEIGTQGNTDEEKLENARTWVIDFPVKSGSERTKDDVTVKEQFDTYFDFQHNYTEHNSSNTITVKPNEWAETEQIVWDNWDDFVGVSFLSHDGGSYELAPYEEINKEKYDSLKDSMKLFDSKLLHKYEESETESDLENMDSCESGICPIR